MILIVDDEQNIRKSLAGLLEDEGWQTAAVSSAEKAEKLLGKEDIELILLDIQMPGKDGITFLDDNHDALKSIPVIIISGRSDIPTAVAAIKLGSYDFIEKPLNPERVIVTVRQALRLSQAIKNESELVARLLDRYCIIGESREINTLRTLIEKAAQSDAHLLITGESGTGKELVAYHVHYRSERRTRKLVAVNCPAIPENLFESELFGHVKGAFTGAHSNRTGRFEKADNSSLFLDEIGDMPLAMQGKLLRVLESGSFEKVGSDESVQVNTRIIAATNCDLEKMIPAGRFRGDLYYRLNVLNIAIPPLRQRTGDIPLLVEHFLQMLNAAETHQFTPDALGKLAAMDWPGNIRQLKNLVEKIVFTTEPSEITSETLDGILGLESIPEVPPDAPGENKLTAATRQFETGFLTGLYKRHNGNIAAMARDLNMDRGNLSKKLRLLKIV